MTILLFTIYNMGFSQKSLLIPDTTIVIPKLNFDSKGDLIIKASPTSSSKDFNYRNAHGAALFVTFINSRDQADVIT
jgi:hypothetical protein